MTIAYRLYQQPTSSYSKLKNATELITVKDVACFVGLIPKVVEIINCS